MVYCRLPIRCLYVAVQAVSCRGSPAQRYKNKGSFAINQFCKIEVFSWASATYLQLVTNQSIKISNNSLEWKHLNTVEAQVCIGLIKYLTSWCEIWFNSTIMNITHIPFLSTPIREKNFHRLQNWTSFKTKARLGLRWCKQKSISVAMTHRGFSGKGTAGQHYNKEGHTDSGG